MEEKGEKETNSKKVEKEKEDEGGWRTIEEGEETNGAQSSA